ncbi:MAG: OsmC family protein [Roseivirga sp.]|nr:OsmC family protein [Roseivirga sp.]
MTGKTHHYETHLKWTGNQGTGTSSYQAYGRDYSIAIGDKPELLGSSDPAFRGDPGRHNPEDLLVASLSSCHMLCYLHLCAVNKVVVLEYEDQATGVMVEAGSGGHFEQVTLHPKITLADASMIEKADKLHEQANKVCFIANSVNFPVHHEASYTTANQGMDEQ